MARYFGADGVRKICWKGQVPPHFVTTMLSCTCYTVDVHVAVLHKITRLVMTVVLCAAAGCLLVVVVVAAFFHIR